jgi:hypothetical protein
MLGTKISHNEEGKLVIEWGVPIAIRIPFAIASALVALWILNILYGYVELIVEYGFLIPPFINLLVFGSLFAITSLIASGYDKFFITLEGIENWSGPKVWRFWQYKKTMHAKHDIGEFTVSLIVLRHSKGFEVHFTNKSSGKKTLLCRVGSEAEAQDIISKAKQALG